MHAVARLAGEAVRADLSGAGMVERRDAELRLDPLARCGDRCPGLAGVNRYAQRRPRDIYALRARGLGKPQRIRGRAHQHRRLRGDDGRHSLGR